MTGVLVCGFCAFLVLCKKKKKKTGQKHSAQLVGIFKTFAFKNFHKSCELCKTVASLCIQTQNTFLRPCVCGCQPRQAGHVRRLQQRKHGGGRQPGLILPTKRLIEIKHLRPVITTLSKRFTRTAACGDSPR